MKGSPPTHITPPNRMEKWSLEEDYTTTAGEGASAEVFFSPLESAGVSPSSKIHNGSGIGAVTGEYCSPASSFPTCDSTLKRIGSDIWLSKTSTGLTTVRSFLGRLSTDVDNPVTIATAQSATDVRPSKSPQSYSRRIRVSKDDYLTNFRVPIGQSYVIRRRLGQGSWGAVHEAVERSSGFLRAIKKIPKKADLTRFRQEMTILKGFDHPRIIRLYETFEDYGHLYMVMEYCRGGELFDRLAEEGPLPEPVAAFLMKQILSALAYCHSRGVVHRDLKPENFLFLDKDIRSPLKLVDFGLAKRVLPSTLMSSAVGTIYYLAPELLAGEYDYRVDCWSAGIILYIMLFGVPPFMGDSETYILRAIRDGNIDYTKRPISNSARDLIMSLCCRDPDRRLLASDALNHPWFKAHWPSPLLHLDVIIPLTQARSEPLTMVLPLPPGGVGELPSNGSEGSDSTYVHRAASVAPFPHCRPGERDTGQFCCDFAELQSGHAKRCILRTSRNKVPKPAVSPTLAENDVHLAGALTHLRKLGVQNQEEAAKLADKLVEKWKHFATLNPLKRALLSLAAQQLEHARELSYIRAIFDLLDMDGDGILSKEELSHALHRLRSIKHDSSSSLLNHQAMSEPQSLDSELSELTAYVDLDGNGQIEYSEFAAACLDSSTYTQESTERAVFRLLDRDGDGRIGQGELKRALGWSADELSTEKIPPADSEFISQIIMGADADKDGYIGAEDFKAILDSDDDTDETSRLYNAEELPPSHIYDEAMGRSCDQFDFSVVARNSFYGMKAEPSMDRQTSHQVPNSDGAGKPPSVPFLNPGQFTQEALDEMRRYKLEQSRIHMQRCLRDQYVSRA
eukprot:Gregarina_sp_Poly_1__10508@NODE_770_length_6346_cov_91_421086_g567_i0_p1_GENE_NODE_770_length_6346_cov_91_421086_g567_i0NODE_770_length_6346_cov_91_421086_g567_i0_p1_ORF_typecomplete_len851_score104_80Pkinase/PF00069_25/2_9e73Pkinase/PF00069_25/1_1e03Pkinase_Tyr/PF07714_17/2_2e42Pkinase_Tyr/PF07714_17/4_3e02EFhand_7/PF13499_6/3_1e12EFhand_7/PF13499_6/3_2e10EFhand_1/PF00036_32/0_00042EFhand_1/PF00036_32/0_0025EFhand_1/PF00036_32/0_0007EFhand_1/PF00036_32/0_011EFhand_6/PF13405_6/2_1e05EFhand_6/PF1